MKYNLSREDKEWADETYQKICTKLNAECSRSGDKIVYTPDPKTGRYGRDLAETDVSWWTNGFWGGILWQMYHATGETQYREAAEGVERKLDRAFEEYSGLHHDVGFMYLPTAVADYRVTGSPRSLARGEHAANLLAGRYNPLGKFIRAWNDNSASGDTSGWIIIDCMMNIQLLFWAGETEKDPRFTAIAKAHADTVLEKLIRPDGSCSHIGVLDPMTDDLLETPGGQGYAPGSSWSRGQSWAITGFALAFHHTKEQRYLDAAKRVAHYFLANVAMTGNIPLADFRAPAEPVYYDTTAAACAACGLLEIASWVGEYEKPLYQSGALRMLQAVDKRFCDWNPETDGMVTNGMVNYHAQKPDDIAPIIYGDYFYLEAVLRLLDKSLFIW